MCWGQAALITKALCNELLWVLWDYQRRITQWYMLQVKNWKVHYKFVVLMCNLWVKFFCSKRSILGDSGWLIGNNGTIYSKSVIQFTGTGDVIFSTFDHSVPQQTLDQCVQFIQSLHWSGWFLCIPQDSVINTWIYDSELFYQWEKWTNQKHFYVKPDVIKEVKLFSQSEWIFGFLHCGTNFPPKKLESN